MLFNSYSTNGVVNE